MKTLRIFREVSKIVAVYAVGYVVSMWTSGFSLMVVSVEFVVALVHVFFLHCIFCLQLLFHSYYSTNILHSSVTTGWYSGL